MPDVYEERQVFKTKIELYKQVAKTMGHNQTGNVTPMDDGAFADVTVWIPLELMRGVCLHQYVDTPAAPPTYAQRCKICGAEWSATPGAPIEPKEV